MKRIKIVKAVDGRVWMVRRKLEWSDPMTNEGFEHDMEGGRLAAIAIVSIMGLLWVALFTWMAAGRQGVVFPWWIAIFLVGLALFFPARWVLRRPCTLVAETAGGADGRPGELWVGWVRGMATARTEMQETVHQLETRATPAYVDSPLQPVS